MNTEMEVMMLISKMNDMGAGVILMSSNEQVLSAWLRGAKLLHAWVHPIVAEASWQVFPVKQPIVIFSPILEHDKQLIALTGLSAPSGRTPEEISWSTGMLNRIKENTYCISAA